MRTTHNFTRCAATVTEPDAPQFDHETRPILSTADQTNVQPEPPKDEKAVKKPEDEADVGDSAVDADTVGEDELFAGSTHHFAIHFGSKQNISGLIIAYFVLAMQMVLYCVVASKVLGDLSGDDLTIPVEVQFGKDCKELNKNKAGEYQALNLKCPPEQPNLSYVALAAVLLAFFLMHDIVAGVRVWLTIPGMWAKIAAFIIVFEALLAALIGTLFAVGANDGYDAIANCIGVLFIHDADEKALEAFQVINAEQLRQSKCCKNRCCGGKIMSKCCSYTKLAALFITTFIIMVLALMLGGAIRAVQRAHVIESYGEDYWDQFFSDGYYDWWADYDYYYWNQ